MARRVELTKTSKLHKTVEGHNLEPQLLFTLTPDWIEMFRKWKEVELVCARCGIVYNDIENIGAWRCKQHASTFNWESKGKFHKIFTWDCCGSKEYKNISSIPSACVRCDHRPVDVNYTTPINDVVIPSVLVQYLINFTPESLVQGEDLIDYEATTGVAWDLDTYTIIRRFDSREESARLTLGETAVSKIFMNGVWREQKDLSWYGLK